LIFFGFCEGEEIFFLSATQLEIWKGSYVFSAIDEASPREGWIIIGRAHLALYSI